MYTSNKSIVFFNGEFISPQKHGASFFSQALHYGYAAFEGMRAYSIVGEDEPTIFELRAHLIRLQKSVETLHLKLPYSIEELESHCYELLRSNNLKDAYIRPLVFGDDNMFLSPTSKVNVFIGAWKWDKYFKDRTVRIMLSSYRKPSPDAFKTQSKISGHYVNGILANREAQQFGYDEALLLDQDGNLGQAAAGNIFFEKEGVLYTPKVGHVFPGITRKTLIELARYSDTEVIEKDCSLEELKNADGAFLTGTAVEVQLLSSLNKNNFGLELRDTIGFELARLFRAHVTNNNTNGTVV